MEIGNSFLIQHFSDAVWLVHPHKLRTMTEIILKKASDYDGSLNLLQLEPKETKVDNVQYDGRTAVLNIEGVLVPKASWLDAMCGFSSTLGLHNQFNELVDNPKIERIVLYFDSPGGESTGIPEFAESIFQARSKKEIVGFTDVCMCSAAFWLGSATENLVVTPSSVIGSIGVYISIIKEKPESSIFDFHIISAGDNKLFGDPNVPITDEEIKFFQDLVNLNYKMFTEAVAKYRNINVEDVKNTKASYYTSADAPKWMYNYLGNTKMVLTG